MPFNSRQATRPPGGFLSGLAVALIAAALAVPAAAVASSANRPYEIGVLPFADGTGSGNRDLPAALAAQVASKIAGTRGIRARVLALPHATEPQEVDEKEAIALGRSQGVDAVLVGSIVAATASKSSHQTGSFSIGGFSVGGNVHSVKADVTLQGSLYDVTSGRKLDTFRAVGQVSKTGVGAGVDTDLGSFSTDSSFEDSPLGKALTSATAELAKRVSSDRAKLSYACVAPPGSSVFGSKEKTEVSMEGKIYFLPADTGRLPDFSRLTSVGSIYTAKWDIPERDFSQGFPGVTDRFEWFAVDYRGTVYVPKTGKYHFRLGSDDGSILYLDGAKVVVNDDTHSWREESGDVDLTQGEHAFRLSYFQGPRYGIGLQLWVTPPGGKEKIFALQDFDRQILQDRSDLGVTEEAGGILVKFGSDVLFAFDKYALKPGAGKGLGELAQLLRGYPGHPVVVAGYTDDVGKPAYNKKLSLNRAASVKDWLVANGQVPEACISIEGYGEADPVASNATAEGRQRNRRVEVHIVTPASLGGR